MEESIDSQPKTQDKINVTYSRLKRRVLNYTWLVRGAILGFFILGIYLAILLVGFIFRSTPVGSFIALSGDFIFTPKEKIESLDGRTTVLILGKGGEGHEAPDLTDTVILASISLNTPEIKTFSLPRDIWIPELRSKLNSVYYWGNQKQVGGGIILAKSAVEKISGKTIEYGVVVDFSSFKDVIDTLGGVEVEVERTFTDAKYPIPGKENDECEGDPAFTCRYETIHFEKGVQVMDGETALKFARSRNAEGEEGTDFARSARQQKIISAISQKVLSSKILLSPKTLFALWEIARGSIETDLTDSASVILARKLIASRDNFYSFVLPEELLVNPPESPKYDNLYVFIPKAEDWGEVHKWFNCIVASVNCN